MRCRALIGVLAAFVLLAILIACSGGGNAPTRVSISPAAVSVTISDPATCSSAASGLYSNVWATITDVLIHTSSTVAATIPTGLT